MSIAVFTSTENRHRFFANELASRLPVRLLVREPKQYRPYDVGENEREKALVRRYFGQREEAEKKFFSGNDELHLPRETQVVDVRQGIDDPVVLEAVRRTGVTLGAVFGTSIIREPLISALRLVNLHLGISPHYRGSATNFWAMHNGDFHMVGATIHYLDAGIDSGPIICHVRTHAERGDSPHTYGSRVIRTATERMADVLEVLTVRGDVPATKQSDLPPGRLYKRADFTAAALQRMLARWDDRLTRYLRNQEEASGSQLITWEQRLIEMAS